MDKMLIINLVLMVLFVIALTVLWLKGKKEVVKSIILQGVIKAEELFARGENQAKEDFVLNIIAGYANQIWILKWITKDTLKKWIKYAVDYMKVHLGSTAQRELGLKNLALDYTKTKVQELADKVVKADFNGDKNLIDNWKAIDLKNEVLGSIDKDFEGVYAKLKTGFTKKTTSAEIGIVKKF